MNIIFKMWSDQERAEKNYHYLILGNYTSLTKVRDFISIFGYHTVLLIHTKFLVH